VLVWRSWRRERHAAQGYTVRRLFLAPKLEIASDVEQLLWAVNLEGGSNREGNFSMTFDTEQETVSVFGRYHLIKTA